MSGFPTLISAAGQSIFRNLSAAAVRRRILGPVKVAVDLGCGVGDWTLRYARFSERAIGVDVNPNFIREANVRREKQASSARVLFVVGDIARYHLPPRVELVCLGSVFQYLDADEVDGVIAAAANVQQRGDVLYVRASVAAPGCRAWSSAVGHYREPSFYDGLFAKHRYRPLWTGTSVALAIDGLSRGILSTRSLASQYVGRPAGDKPSHTLFANWLLRSAKLESPRNHSGIDHDSV